MTIDTNMMRVDRGGDPEAVIASEKKRGRDGQSVKAWLEVDEVWRKELYDLEQLRKHLNDISKQVGQRKKTDNTDACQDLIDQTTETKNKIVELESLVEGKAEQREKILKSIGNIVADSVHVSNNEDENLVVRTWGIPNKIKIDGTPGHMHHHEVLARLNAVEMKKGAEIAGHRAYFMKGCGVILNMALQKYGMDFLQKQGYCPIQTPFFLRRDVMAATVELADFNETLYRIPMSPNEAESSKDDLFLIATSEQPISALHKGEFIEEKQLPFKYAGVSTCFRKEAGSSGKDVWGLFRVHQFEKIEQFIYATPEDSWRIHDEMIESAEAFYKSLELPYRIVSIVSGALNDAAAKKYDLEAWFPGYDAYRELVSCSNCTDYQSRSLEVRLGHPKMGDREKKYVHMLNATLCATHRDARI
eukprot:GHVO01034352.1.p1 GENE.GHVO01034352.1~~GHVO01034352.1.p1  ORF type:complete len:417 (-),score=84.14 GHVO01034352.1:606-1856(-)